MGIYAILNSRKQEIAKEKGSFKVQNIQDKVAPLVFLLTRKYTSC